jgi:hypothetical protein
MWFERIELEGFKRRWGREKTRGGREKRERIN